MKNKNLIIAVVLAVIIGALLVVFARLNIMEINNSVLSFVYSPNRKAVAVPASATSSWQSYQSDDASFAFKYPLDFKVLANNTIDGKKYINVEPQQDPSPFYYYWIIRETPAGSSGVTLEQRVESIPGISRISRVNVNGKEVLEVTLSEDGSQGEKITTAYFEKDQKIYEFSYVYSPSNQADYSKGQELFYQMISTFRFLR